MGSKQVLDEGKQADLLVQAVRTNAAELAQKRAAQYAAAGLKNAPGATALEAVLLADASLLEKVHESLRRADKRLGDELGDDAAVFKARDDSAAAARAILVEFRDLVQTNCGAVAVREVGFLGDTPRDPSALEALGKDVLQKVEASPPRSAKKGVRFDARASLEGLAGEIKTLAKANADVRREKREEQAARAARDAEWDLFTREVSSAQRILDGRLRAVSLDAIADRITPSSSTTAPSEAPVEPPAPETKPG